MSDSNTIQRFDPFAQRDISEEEKEYWEKEYPDEETFLKLKSIDCSSCGKDIRKAIINDRKLFIHPALEVVICSKCIEFYNNGEFSVDEDGSDMYCRWCGQGGNLYCCSSCSVAICNTCVKRNLTRKYLKEIQRDDWKCFVCDPQPIWSFRAICQAAKRYVENYKPSKTPKRSRKNVDSDSESDSDSKVTKKKSKREVANGSEDENEDESEDSESSHSGTAKKKAKVSKARNRVSDSDEIFTSSSAKKKARKPRSEKFSSPLPKKRASVRSRRRVTNSGDDSSSTSTARTSSRKRNANVDSNDSSASSPRKKNSRSKGVTTSTNTSSPTSARKSSSKRRSQNDVSSQSSSKKERNLLELALIDVNNDFRQFSKILAKQQMDCEVKYLKNKKNKDPDRWQTVKDKYLGLLNDTVDSAIGMRDSFLKCLENIDNESELMNGDEVPEDNETNENNDTTIHDDTADLNSDAASLKGDETMEEETETEPKNVAHVEESEDLFDQLLNSGSENKSKTRINDTTDEMETSTQSEQNAHETSAEDDGVAERDEKAEDSPEKNADSSGSMETARSTANDSVEDSFENASDSVANTPQKDEFSDSTLQKDEFSDSTSQKDEFSDCALQKNGHVSDNEDSDLGAKSAKDDGEEDEIRVPGFTDKCSVKLPRIPERRDIVPPNLSESDKETLYRSDILISGINALMSPVAEEVEMKKTDESPTKESSVFESTRIGCVDDEFAESDTLDESLTKEDEAKKCLLNSGSSSDEEQEKTDLNDSSIIATRKKTGSKRCIVFDSDSDVCDNENKSENHTLKSDDSRLVNGSVNAKKENGIKKDINDSNLESSTDERSKSNERNIPVSVERDTNAKREGEAKKGLLDSSSDESHISDSDEDRTKEMNGSNNVIPNEETVNSQREDEAKKSLLTNSSDSDENEINFGDHSPQKQGQSSEKEKIPKIDQLDDSDSDNPVENGLINSAKKNSARNTSVNGGDKKTENSEDEAKKRLLNSDTSDGVDSDEHEKEILKLTNLKNLTRKRQRTYVSSSDERECVTEVQMETDSIPAEDVSRKSSAEKKKRLLKSKTSLEAYLTDNNEDDSSADDLSFSKFKSQLFEKKNMFSTKEDMAKRLLLNCRSTDETDSDSDDFIFDKEEKPKKRQKKESKKMATDNSDDEIKDKSGRDSNSESDAASDNESKKKKSQWRNDPLLHGKLSATDTSDEERMIRRAREKYDQKEKVKQKGGDSSDSEDIFVSRVKKPSTKKKRFVLHSSNSEEEVEMQTLSSTISSDESEKKQKKKKKTTKRRRRIKNRMSDDSESEKELNQTGGSQKGRKNIREIMKERDLDAETRRTAKEEEARKKRLAERQALFNKVFEVKDTSDQVLKKLVLDYDAESKNELVSVSPQLLAKLKPHQAEGVKFMWDACFESLKQVEKGKGGGCILAHCMGLGKTLQVITLVHTLLRHEETKVRTILVICPLTTVLNWRAEFEKWLEDLDDYDDFNIYELTKFKNNAVRADHLRHWNKNGGIMILGYEMFRSLVTGKTIKEKARAQICSALLDPGPDLVICDEGHILKNEKSAISKATMRIQSLRRIVLTGTPLQNNLIEYHCMVQFVKPNLLGNKREFQNRFVNPITNGQYVDSTLRDVRIMKSRAHVLHRMLDGIVQRFDYNVLKPFLPPKHEFVISVGLSDLQAKLYEYYIEHKSQIAESGGSMRLFKDYQIMRLIWTHPLAMKLSADRHQKIQDKEESDHSLKDFVVSGSDSDESNSNKSVVTLSSDEETKKESARLTRAKKNELGIDLEVARNSPPEVVNQWWSEFVSDEDLEDYKQGPKLMLLFAILRQSELIGDKVLIFSQSIPSLDMIEHFLTKNEEFSQRLPPDSSFQDEAEDFIGTWEKNKDYFRLDGQTPNEVRAKYCKAFNNPNNTRVRLFLISTKAGGLGINLTAANRVIIFDASWNPSYDIQSIFRVYRFGQNKPCYIYRFLSQGTMEEKIYERQVTKLSVSCRVVDEQQIDRHFSRKDITELYTFNRKSPIMDEVPKLPSDRLMAELLKQYKDVIINYHEHDSLLENIEDEELTEEERLAAWKEYEDEKNRPLSRPTNMIPNNILQEVNSAISDQAILQTIRKLYPAATTQQLTGMLGTVRQKLLDYYMNQARSNPGMHIPPVAPMNLLTASMNDAQNPATEQQIQDTLKVKQAALLNALQTPMSANPLLQSNFVSQSNFVPQANSRPIPPNPTFVDSYNVTPSTSNVPGRSQPSSTHTEPQSDPLA